MNVDPSGAVAAARTRVPESPRPASPADASGFAALLGAADPPSPPAHPSHPSPARAVSIDAGRPSARVVKPTTARPGGSPPPRQESTTAKPTSDARDAAEADVSEAPDAPDASGRTRWADDSSDAAEAAGPGTDGTRPFGDDARRPLDAGPAGARMRARRGASDDDASSSDAAREPASLGTSHAIDAAANADAATRSPIAGKTPGDAAAVSSAQSATQQAPTAATRRAPIDGAVLPDAVDGPLPAIGDPGGPARAAAETPSPAWTGTSAHGGSPGSGARAVAGAQPRRADGRDVGADARGGATSVRDIVELATRASPDPVRVGRDERALDVAAPPFGAASPFGASWMPGTARIDPPAAATGAMPSFPIAVPVHDPAFGGAFAERVVWMLREGLQGAELTLRPQELGPITIELAIDGDAATLGVVATNAETRGAIEQALPRLRELLAGQGLQLGGAQVDAGHGRSADQDARGRGRRTDASRDTVSALGAGPPGAGGALAVGPPVRAGGIDVFA